MAHPLPDRSLQGKVAIVTGAGSVGEGIGNGRATSVLLAQDGCKVICVDLDLSLAKRTVEMVEQEVNGVAMAMSADVTKEEDCQRIVNQAIEAYGRLDILINNVGIMGPKGTSVDIDIEAFNKAMVVNVSSMVLMAKHAIPKMIENEGQVAGSIVNIGSTAALLGGNPAIFYPTSKGTAINMTRAMAAHHGKDRIRVNCVCPGMVYTPMVGGVEGGMSEDQRKARLSRSLLRTEGTAWDVAAAVRFLSSDCARWITGVILPVDAGTTATSNLNAQGAYVT